MTKSISNEEIADVLARIADLLEVQDANRYRVNAYRRAARVIGQLDEPAADMIRSGDGRVLEDLPDIGKSIGGTVREYVHTGRSGLLDRLEGQTAPENLLRTVPNIGPELARRIHDELDIDTLEELEQAAHDGRLETVTGIGHRRAEAIRGSAGALLNRSGRRRSRRRRLREKSGGPSEAEGNGNEPSVHDILAVDAEYRRRAAAGDLKTIAPRRFNPEKKTWLPILHTEKGDWDFTALFSNTARAHDLAKTRDWVVIYYERDGYEDQCTVVTENRGPLTGRRVIRGRERACLAYYSKRSAA
jgi:ERCC4-type nuclease